MKISQQKTGMAEKKPLSSTAPALSAASSPASINPTKTTDGFASPSAAVWSKYIDSRMKQFGTR